MERPLTTGTVPMADGRAATVWRCRAPLPHDVGMPFAWFLEGAFGADEMPDIFLTAAAKGLLEETARNDFAWAEVDGTVVATAWTMTSADEPRLATMGEVYTDPAWRGNGLAPAVCRTLLERFDEDGGQIMFLGTGNPSAARIYTSLGFRPFPRGLMRRDASGSPDDFDGRWFAPSTVAVREITWGDTPRIVALYAAGNPWLSACWMQGLYSASHVTHDRCNSLVKHTWQATRSGAWLGMVNAQGALVGSGPMEPRGNEMAAIGADVDIFVHPSAHGQAPILLAAMIERGRAHGWRWLRAELGDGDLAKRDLLLAAGFREVGRVSDALEINGISQAVGVLRLDLWDSSRRTGPAAPAKAPASRPARQPASRPADQPVSRVAPELTP